MTRVEIGRLAEFIPEMLNALSAWDMWIKENKHPVRDPIHEEELKRHAIELTQKILLKVKK